MELKHIEGLDLLGKALQELPKNIGRNVLRGAVNAGATVIRKEAVMRVPIDTGKLRKAIYQKQIRELSSAVQQTFFVGWRHGKKERAVQRRRKRGGQTVTVIEDRDAYYGRFVEFGTAKMAAQPFMRPAYESQKEAALQAIREYIANRLPAEVAKLSK